MAEHPVVGKAALHCLFEGVHGIDSFADERATEKQVLIDIGNRLGVRIDTSVAAEQSGIGRTRRAGQADTDPGLQDGVA
ncbi:hypothetical protein D3C80_1824610 [compost metagenome]